MPIAQSLENEGDSMKVETGMGDTKSTASYEKST